MLSTADVEILHLSCTIAAYAACLLRDSTRGSMLMRQTLLTCWLESACKLGMMAASRMPSKPAFSAFRACLSSLLSLPFELWRELLTETACCYANDHNMTCSWVGFRVAKI